MLHVWQTAAARRLTAATDCADIRPLACGAETVAIGGHWQDRAWRCALPPPMSAVGSGRDAACLASLGFEVIAAQPAHMHREGRSRHPELHSLKSDLQCGLRAKLRYCMFSRAIWLSRPEGG